MIAAGIDPSLTSTGVAVLVDGKLKHAARYGRDGRDTESHRTGNNRIRILRTEVWKAATIAGTPDIVVMEGHPHTVNNSGHVFDRGGLWHMIFEAFDARQIPIVTVHPATHKAWVTGAGQASKLAVIDVIDEWYGDQLDKPLAEWRKCQKADDVADALGYATIGAYKLGDPIPFEPKMRHQTGLAQLPWPKIARAR